MINREERILVAKHLTLIYKSDLEKSSIEAAKKELKDIKINAFDIMLLKGHYEAPIEKGKFSKYLKCLIENNLININDSEECDKELNKAVYNEISLNDFIALFGTKITKISKENLETIRRKREIRKACGIVFNSDGKMLLKKKDGQFDIPSNSLKLYGEDSVDTARRDITNTIIEASGRSKQSGYTEEFFFENMDSITYIGEITQKTGEKLQDRINKYLPEKTYFFKTGKIKMNETDEESTDVNAIDGGTEVYTCLVSNSKLKLENDDYIFLPIYTVGDAIKEGKIELEGNKIPFKPTPNLRKYMHNKSSDDYRLVEDIKEVTQGIIKRTKL